MPSSTSRFLLALLLAAAFPTASGESAPGARTEPTALVLGTATLGGSFQLFGQTLADVINTTDPNLGIEAVATEGSTENVGDFCQLAYHLTCLDARLRCRAGGHRACYAPASPP
jgi:TRAP-type uncharacterized transport system substrate-binding protein